MADKTLFFALWPSHRQRELMRDNIGPAMSTVEGNAVDRRNWHVTLVYIGDFPEEKIPGLLSAVDVIEPEEDLMAIGSGGPFAQAAALALLRNSDLEAREIVEQALAIAGDICVYTNQNITVEEL